MAFQTQIKFKGEVYLLIGDLDKGGSITTKEAYENFEISYAHLFSDGRVMRFNEQIGTRDDIEILDAKIYVSAMLGLMSLIRGANVW